MPISIEDPNLVAAIKDTLGIYPQQEIMQSDVANLTNLDASAREIGGICGLDQFTNLEVLDLNSNNLTYVENLGKLSNLAKLNLSNNHIHDFFLENLIDLDNLAVLNLSYNENIENIYHLMFLANLSILDLRGNTLDNSSCYNYIPQLEARGVNVLHDCIQVNPQVSSESGRWGDTVSQPGWGFTPNGQAELHFRHQSGIEETAYEDVLPDGTYQHHYTIPNGKLTGTWYYWGVDLSSGLSSPQVSYTISSSVTISPYVTVNPSTGSKSSGTVLNEPGFGFTPYGPVTLHFIDPNGIHTTISKTADENGYYTHSYTCHSDTAEGEWEYYAYDETADIQTGSVYITIIP